MTRFVPFLFMALLGASDVRYDGDGSVDVDVSASLGLSFKVHNDVVTYHVEDAGGVFDVGATSFKSGLSLRDEHLRRAIDASRFSKVTLTVPLQSVAIPVEDDSTSGDVIGHLQFHGVTKDVSVHYAAVADCEGHVGVKSTFDVDVTDFGVIPPTYMGVSVKPVVHVTARARMIKER